MVYQGQWTVKEKLRDMIQWYYYKWGEWSGQAEGLNLATATVTARTTTALDSERQPREAGAAIRWRQGATSADIEHYGSSYPTLGRARETYNKARSQRENLRRTMNGRHSDIQRNKGDDYGSIYNNDHQGYKSECDMRQELPSEGNNAR
ncbi:hypothetical protein M404DRAFT_33818 [Pisolithus tinctorius Marx 270]|uniref:Uncharacterized protein n=1 Tax=Pisolithus tinctorius Marx 270 TaxID=870435 RepID=A0A0C3JE11_PISTI|nr:hypothetical protein M404DRAFT_33818 [Pisolithus tinctorius Marx 270]